MRAVHKDLMKMIVVELRELEARAEPKTGSKAWLRPHARLQRELVLECCF